MKTIDYMSQLVNYFKKNLKKGYPLDALKFSLINQGYSRTAVESALETANKELATEAPKFKEKPMIKHELIDEDDNSVEVKKPWWKKIFRK